MCQIQSFVECWILKFSVLFDLKYSDLIYLYISLHRFMWKTTFAEALSSSQWCAVHARWHSVFEVSRYAAFMAMLLSGWAANGGNATDRVNKRQIHMWNVCVAISRQYVIVCDWLHGTSYVTSGKSLANKVLPWFHYDILLFYIS